VSYWEIKTSDDPWAEGLKDFRKRSDEISEEERAVATFVFVSSRIWDSSRRDRKIEDWVSACNAEFAWKKVRCLDAVALEAWLDLHPAVAARFARYKIGNMPQRGARSTDEFWNEFRHGFDPPLVEDVLLAGREQRAATLVEALMRPEGATYLVSDSPDEVIAFGVAAIRTAKPEVRTFLEARTIVVDEMTAGRELLALDNLSFLLRGETAEVPGMFKGASLVPLSRYQPGGKATLLDRPSADALAAALEKMHFDRVKAFQFARGSGRSLTALRRRIPAGSVPQPKWVESASTVLPAILAGGWDMSNGMDRDVLSMLAQTATYAEFERRLHQFVRQPDPPVDLIRSVWTVRAPMDAFLLAGDHIDEDVLERLRAVLAKVFSHVKPPPDPKAFVRPDPENPDDFSEWLRDGLATTLLQIAVWDQLAGMPILGSGQAFANRVVSEIPGLGTPRVLAALKDQLPYLAEAAPGPLLVALERTLEGSPDVLRPLFDEVEGFLHPVSQHTGLLWALEVIAWDPEYFERAVLILARLASLDPGGRLTNRPINSLREIFLPWRPRSKASAQQRLAALDKICRILPDIGWALIAKMLPTMYGSSSGTARPRLRESTGGEAGVTYAEYWEMQAAAVQRAIELTGSDPNRWAVLISDMSNLRPAERTTALARLDTTLEQLGPDQGRPILEELRSEVEKHERFPTAKWVLPHEELAPMRALVDKYTPKDPLEQARILFDSWSFDGDGNRETIDRARQATLKSILAQYGPAGVVTLGRAIKNSHNVVEAVEHLDIPREDLEAAVTLSLSAAEPDGLTLGLIAVLRVKFGAEAAQGLVTQLRGRFSDAHFARLLLPLPDNQDTWRFVNTFGESVEAGYWRSKGSYWLKGSTSELVEAIDNYIRFGRAIAALEASLQRLNEVPAAKIFEILEAVVSEVNARGPLDGAMLTYEVERAFATLDSREDVSAEDVARREIMLFPLLEYGQRKMRLFDVMAANADVYYQVLAMVFLADGDPQPSELGERERSLWRLNYSILSKFSHLPGMTPEGINPAVLSSWIARVRELAKKGRRADIADQYIGHILAYAPSDAHGVWPIDAVRDQIESLDSDEVEQGIRIERFNMRGAHTRAVYAGGDQERALARQYYDYAQTMDAWPRTQVLLRSIAKNWEADAMRQDEWAEQRKAKS